MAITIEVALEINVTMRRKTRIAITTALGFTPIFFYMKKKLGLLSSFESFRRSVICSMISDIYILLNRFDFIESK
jgi:hypothetical protein